MTGEPCFDAAFRDRLATLIAWRRDVRRFKPDPIPALVLEELLRLADLAPSVGNSQPWRFVLVEDPALRRAVRDDFEAANREALEDYSQSRAALYARLKLSGLDVAPVQLAVFCDEDTTQGGGLGRKTMPETLDYSAVGAVQILWLAARAFGIGVGWVSIMHPEQIAAAMGLPQDWRLVAYLCIGWPVEEHTDPELQRAGWQARTDFHSRLLTR